MIRTLETEPSGSIAVLARHWADLDPIRAVLESRGVAFSIHHSDQHRPLHRRHPFERLLRTLWEQAEPLTGSARERLERMILDMKRSPEELALALEIAQDLDQSRALRPAGDGDVPELLPASARELADALLAGSRDWAARNERTPRAQSRSGAGAEPSTARVHLSTFHGAKGLEFDKVLVLPTFVKTHPARVAEDAEQAPAQERLIEERRGYFVAMTRARRELGLATLGRPDELASEVELEIADVRPFTGLIAPRVGYLDCTPSEVQLTSSELARAQRVIAGLREGASLEIETGAHRTRFTSRGTLVAVLSRAGEEAFQSLRSRCPGPVVATVHEVFVHLIDPPRKDPKRALRRTLVVLPSIRAGALTESPVLTRAMSSRS